MLAPVILRLEDFGHDLRLDSVQAVVEYIYRGEVLIESDKFMDVAEAAHTLGINGLKDFLPDPTGGLATKRRKVSPADSSTEKEESPLPLSSSRNSGNGSKSPQPEQLSESEAQSPARKPRSPQGSREEQAESSPNKIVKLERLICDH